MPSTTSRISRSGAVSKIKNVTTSKPRPHPQTPSSDLRNGMLLKELPHDKSRGNRQVKEASLSSSASKPAEGKRTPTTKTAVEKRLRKYRSKPPSSFLVKLERAQTQRMIVLGRRRDTIDGVPSEEVEIVGSTGNVYTVTISHQPTCTCPDSLRGNECKHKVYVLSTVLKAPLDLQYQLALLSSELETIFAHAPPIPTYLAEDSDGNRKPTDGECPICYMDLDEEHNKLVWCKSQCGHNLHKSCFDQWAASQGGREVRCVYCRTPWETDVSDLDAVKKAGEYTEEGYVNVAAQFGISRARDYSGYYQPWARRQFGVGW